MKGFVKEPIMFHIHNYETEKITRKASDTAENLQLYQLVRFFRPRSSCPTHLMKFSERPPIYASCMTISGGRTEQLDIIAGFLPRHWLYAWFSSAENVRRNMRCAWWSRVEEPNNTSVVRKGIELVKSWVLVCMMSRFIYYWLLELSLTFIQWVNLNLKWLKSFLFGLSFCLWQRIPFIDYVQCSSSSLYRMIAL